MKFYLVFGYALFNGEILSIGHTVEAETEGEALTRSREHLEKEFKGIQGSILSAIDRTEQVRDFYQDHLWEYN